MTTRPRPPAKTGTDYSMRFCVGCYLPEAMPLVQKLLEAQAHNEGFRLVLTPGPAGSFEIEENQRTVFSKAKTGRLPSPADLGLAKASGRTSKAPGASCG